MVRTIMKKLKVIIIPFVSALLGAALVLVFLNHKPETAARFLGPGK